MTTDGIGISVASASSTASHAKQSFSGGSEEELQQLTERLKKAAAGYGAWKSALTKAKFLPTASSQDHITTLWMNGKMLEEVDELIYCT